MLTKLFRNNFNRATIFIEIGVVGGTAHEAIREKAFRESSYSLKLVAEATRRNSGNGSPPVALPLVNSPRAVFARYHFPRGGNLAPTAGISDISIGIIVFAHRARIARKNRVLGILSRYPRKSGYLGKCAPSVSHAENHSAFYATGAWLRRKTARIAKLRIDFPGAHKAHI